MLHFLGAGFIAGKFFLNFVFLFLGKDAFEMIEILQGDFFQNNKNEKIE